jgi:hypothetical protein
MSDVVRKVETLLETLRRDPSKQPDVCDAVNGLLRDGGDASAIRARITRELDATQNEAYWGALDAVLERVPPASDWILQGERYRPGEDSVKTRALALGALLQQYEYERLIREAREDDDGDKARSDREIVAPDLMREARRHRWLALERVASVLSEEEREVIETDPGAWTDAQCAEASWRSEAFGVVAWALGLVATIPRYDDSFDDEALLDVYEDILEGRATPTLRSWEEISRESRRAEEWHTRSKDVEARSARDRKTNARALRPGPSDAEPIDGDMSLFGKAYFALDDEQLEVARAIAHQRRYAMAWLTGGHFAWDEVTTQDARALN